MQWPIQQLGRRRQSVPVWRQQQRIRLIGAHRIQHCANLLTVDGAFAAIGGQQPDNQIGQSRCRAALSSFRRNRHRPELNGSLQRFPLFLIQTTQLRLMLSRALLPMQRQ